MNKIKKGYTLAEVLITLGIVGTLAALTIPNMFKGTGGAIIGPSLYKTVDSIESGMRNVMQAASDRAEAAQAGQTEVSVVTTTLDILTFSDVLGPGAGNANVVTSANMFGALRGYTGADPVSANDRAYLQRARNYTGERLISATYNFINTGAAYKFKGNKAIFVYGPAPGEGSIAAHTINGHLPEDLVVARIIIDANGQDAPNRFGRDIFLFGLTDNGQMVPAGSEAYNRNVFNATVPMYTAECTNNNITTGASCAARLSADHWKIEYK